MTHGQAIIVFDAVDNAAGDMDTLVRVAVKIRNSRASAAMPFDDARQLRVLGRTAASAVVVHGARHADAPDGRRRDAARVSNIRTWASDIAHTPFEVAEAALSHRVGSAVSRAYARSDMLERRRPVMDEWQGYIDGKDAADVVPLKRA